MLAMENVKSESVLDIKRKFSQIPTAIMSPKEGETFNIPEQRFLCKPGTIPSLSSFQIACDYCGGNFEDIIKFFKHKQICDLYNSKKIKDITSFRKLCFNCPLQFDCMTFLDGYVSLQKEISELVDCDFCEKHFLTKRSFAHKCYACNISTIRTCKQLVRHLKRVHNIKEFQCVVCSSTFSSRYYLKTHIRKHTGENPYTCNICNKEFKASNTLTIHKRSHTGELPYECKYCESRFTNMQSLKRHIFHHTGTKPFSCAFCDKKFTASHSLRYHINKIHPSQSVNKVLFKCLVCGSIFNYECQLRTHIRTHTGEKPYICNICNKRYNALQDLTIHKRIHTGEMPFDCNYCDRSFSNAKSLKRHLLHHTGTKPFECTFCDKKFTAFHSLRYHISKTHPSQ